MLFLDARGIDRSVYDVVHEPSDLAEIRDRADFEPARYVNISTWATAALRSALSAYLKQDESYVLFWFAGRKAIRVGAPALVARIDDFWRPASDDLVVLDERLRPILLIDHEEHLCFPPSEA